MKLNDSTMIKHLEETFSNVEKDMEDYHAHYFTGTHSSTGVATEIKIEIEPVDEEADILEFAISDRPVGSEDWNLADHLAIEQ